MPVQADHVADRQGIELARFANKHQFPAYVKQASLDAIFPEEKQAASAYADPVNRQFLCDTKANTWLSALYFYEKRAEFHPKEARRIEERLDGFAGYWAIRGDLQRLKTACEATRKTAEDQLPDSSFAYVWHGENGSKERRLRLTSAAEVKVAADWLFEHRDEIPFSDRHVMAGKMLQKAAQFGAGLGERKEFLDRQAGRGVCDVGEAVAMVRKRASAFKDIEVKQRWFKVAATIEANPRTLIPQQAVKLATMIDQLDRSIKRTEYGPDYPRPEDVLFKATFEKCASERLQCVSLTSGKIYDKQLLTQVKSADLKDLFGDEFVARVSGPMGIDAEKMAAEVAALPRPDAHMLEDLLRDSGVSPMLVKQADDGFLADRREFFKKMAAAY